MKIKIQMVIEHEDEILGTLVEEISYLQRGTPSLETLGLTLAEGKEILANLQEQIVKQQVTEHVQKFQICSGSTGHREHQKDTEIPEPFLCELCVLLFLSTGHREHRDDTEIPEPFLCELCVLLFLSTERRYSGNACRS